MALATAEAIQGSRRRKTARPEEAATRVRPRCGCGMCTACQDEARWERIFQAKFADPHYYDYHGPRGRSSLSPAR